MDGGGAGSTGRGDPSARRVGRLAITRELDRSTSGAVWTGAVAQGLRTDIPASFASADLAPRRNGDLLRLPDGGRERNLLPRKPHDRGRRRHCGCYSRRPPVVPRAAQAAPLVTRARPLFLRLRPDPLPPPSVHAGAGPATWNPPGAVPRTKADRDRSPVTPGPAHPLAPADILLRGGRPAPPAR